MKNIQNPIIAAVREYDEFATALDSPCEVIFLLKSNILTLKQHIGEAKAKGKKIFVHVDLTDGIGKDLCGIKFIACCKADGIISTKSSLIKCSRSLGLFSVQRVFCVDTQSIENIREIAEASSPDMIELMPGVMPKTISRISKTVNIPIIAGGLIETKEEILSSLKAGAFAISTGKKELWYK